MTKLPSSSSKAETRAVITSTNTNLSNEDADIEQLLQAYRPEVRDQRGEGNKTEKVRRATLSRKKEELT